MILKGRVVRETVRSELLKDNPLGDPHERELPIYLPPGYDEDPDRRYPCIYVLSGFLGQGQSLLNAQPFEPNLAERMDHLIAEGSPPAILALPDCFTSFGGSQYLNSSATGRYKDYVVQELVTAVDERYRTVASPTGRGVLGKSSGGYGAVMLAMRHPEVFGALACHSGDMYFELCYRPDFPKLARAVEQAGGLEQWWRAFQEKLKKEGSDFAALNILAMAAAYSPSPDQPLGVDLPFDLYTCELREQVWAKWLEHDPIHLVESYTEALRGLRLLFLDCGLRDEYNLQYGARIFTRNLKALSIPHEYEEFDDGHSGTRYRYAVSLSKLAHALSN